MDKRKIPDITPDMVQEALRKRLGKDRGATVSTLPQAEASGASLLPKCEELDQTPNELAAGWLETYDQGLLTYDEMMRHHFRVRVPHMYSPRPSIDCLTFKIDEEAEYKNLIEPLERFLSNNEDPEPFFKSLVDLDKPESFCGHVFASGEPTYACRDCGLDPTCVLCIACFKVSPHRNHRYKISNSSGGGYCDCGDPEAWKSDVYCETHGSRVNELEGNCLPPEVQDRAKFLFDILVPYCYDRLTEPFRQHLPDLLLVDAVQLSACGMKGLEQAFCTIVYNDESHTYENVIQTLTRAVGCSKKEAGAYATLIDREGRAVLKCGNFPDCGKLSDTIDRYSTRNGGKALYVSVIPAINVAHESFAIKLLNWLQQTISYASGYREAFYDVMIMVSEDFSNRRQRSKRSNCRTSLLPQPRERISNISLLEGIMLNDTSNWKSARVVWHHLFATGFLKDYNTKKKFAMLFTKHYIEIMKDFLADDHDHSFSVTALSVQIFTVPTIARYLIDKVDAFYLILRSFVIECEPRRGPNGRLEFERGAIQGPFKRTSFSALDLKYLLTTPPTTLEEWNENLKRNFLHGVSELTKLLSWMQEMDAGIRQMGTHLEYDTEWETAFNIFMKLAPVMSLVVDWSATNKSVLIRAYRTVLRGVGEHYLPRLLETVTREYANNSAICYVYDIATQPVSIHSPLTRIWAALHLHLSNNDLEFESSELNTPCKPTVEILIEPVLRSQALAAQVSAGMWKRNGYSILNQFYFYRNVKCRGDMLDKDILALQIGAVLLESNAFLIHALNKFDLFDFVTDIAYDMTGASENEQIRSASHILEEFFGFVISLVSARFTTGVGMVTEQDCIRKEIIQLLCVKPMTHSQLNKAMVENVNYETGVEHVVGDVAIGKRQTVGIVYELKPECYSEYDLFFYHYSREQLSFAENRLVTFKQEKKEPEFFPPPKLPMFTTHFQSIANIFKSDVLLSIFAVVLKRCIGKLSSCTDGQLRRVFHLIGYALNEETVQRDSGVPHPLEFCDAASRWKIFDLLEACGNESSISQHHHMIRWILQQHYLLQPNVPVPNQSCGAPVSPDTSQDDEEKSRRKRMAADAREKMLAKMNAAQNEFRAVNAEMFDEDEPMPEPVSQESSMPAQIAVALGPNQSPRPSRTDSYTCVLCQETQALDANAGFTLPVYIQRSTVQCQNRSKLVKAWRNKLDNKFLWRRDTLYIHPDLCFAPHISCCGHVMHSVCWQRHFETVMIKEKRRPYRLRHMLTFDVDKNEYLCPLCQCLCNAVMPMVSHSNDYFPPECVSSPAVPRPSAADIGWELGIEGWSADGTWQPQFKDWYGMCTKIVENSRRATCSYLPTEDTYKEYCSLNSNGEKGTKPDINPWSTHQTLEEVSATISPEAKQVFKHYFSSSEVHVLNDELKEICNLFMHSIFTKGLGGRPGNDGEFRFNTLTWTAIAYTIINSEAIHRDQNLPFFGSEVTVRQASSTTYPVLAGTLISLYCQLHDLQNLQSTALTRLKCLVVGCSKDSPNILDIDAFGLLVSLTYSLPSLYLKPRFRRPLPLGTLQDYHLLRAVTIMHMMQIILTCNFVGNEFFTTQTDSRVKVEEAIKENESVPSPQSLADVCLKAWFEQGRQDVPPPQNINWNRVSSSIKEAMVPFLRCSAKFFESLTGITPPKCLETVENNYEDLANYLGLSQSLNAYCDDYSDSLLLSDVPETVNSKRSRELRIALAQILFLEHDRISWTRQSYARKLPKLIDLPEDYSELLNSAAVTACNDCGHECRIPTLCLICGEMLCSQSYCCQDDLKGTIVGACNYHSYYCGGSIGIFLRVRECRVFFLSAGGKGCYVSPPYLDAYGETDQGLKRGNPMKLSQEKYEEFRRSWMFHKIHDEIAVTTEQTPTMVPTEWQFL